MLTIKWLNLQLFADGAAAGEGGEGAAPGVNADDAGQQMLRDMGVPEDRIAKRAKGFAQRMSRSGTPMQTAPKGAEQQAAAAEPDTQKTGQKEPEQAKRLSWDEIMADPEYNGEMQKVVQNRLKNARAAQEILDKLAPAIEALCGKHGIDPKNPDYDALAKAVSNDDSLYEELAMQMGVSKETAKRVSQSEAEARRLREAEESRKQEAARAEEERKGMEHIRKLVQQGEAMKVTFPNFDIRQELKDKTFATLTSPNIGMSVEDAYYAVHRKEIQAATAKAMAEKTAEQMANSIRSNGLRPQENGTTRQAPSTSTIDPRRLTPQERADIRRRVRNGEKVSF